MKRILAMLLMSIMIFTAVPYAAAASQRLQLGDQMPDFTMTTYSGESVTLYEVLESKQMVLINLWATWCGPCRSEFPYMQETYQQYRDQVEIIALSTESTDTPAKLKEFSSTYGLTFKVGRDTPNLAGRFAITGIPTSIVVDRFGTICYVVSGALPDVASFERLFEAFIGDEYQESLLLNTLPPMKPDIAPSDDAAVYAALGTAAQKPSDSFIWPMTVTEKDGRQVVASSNAGMDGSTAAVAAVMVTQPGDAIVLTFKTETESPFDLMEISVDGDTIKSFSGNHDWMTYAIPISDGGEKVITISYVKNGSSSVGADTVWIDSIEVLSGTEAQDAIAGNPRYPESDETFLLVDMPQAREIQIQDPRSILYANFGEAKYYIINGDSAVFRAGLSSDVDPEAAFFYTNYDGSITPVTMTIADGSYALNTPVDSLQKTGYSFTTLWLYPDSTGEGTVCAIFFRDEDNVNRFVTANSLGNWSYSSEASAISESRTPLTTVDGKSTYILKCVDQSGNSVSGAMLQVCDNSVCQVFTSDENGMYTFESAPTAWEMHVLKAPTGYTLVTEDVVVAPLEGGEIVFQFMKQ